MAEEHAVHLIGSEPLGQLLRWWPENRTDKDSLMLRGAWLMHTKRFDEAAECLSQAAKTVPDDRGVLLSLAKAYYQAGRLEEAGVSTANLNVIKSGDRVRAGVFKLEFMRTDRTDQTGGRHALPVLLRK